MRQIAHDLVYDRPGDVAAYNSTLVSIVPFPIIEEKPGLIPGTFKVEASTDGRPRVSTVPECTHYVWIDEVRGSLKVRNPSYLVAKSIVRDYLDGQLGARPGAHPGFFWVPGELTAAEVEKKHAERLEEIRGIQLEWLTELVKLGDDAWQQTRQHYSISDEQRYAARVIDPENKHNRPWVFVLKDEAVSPIAGPETTMCPMCGSDIIKGVAICRYCSFVLDPARVANAQFARAGNVGSTGIDLSKIPGVR